MTFNHALVLETSLLGSGSASREIIDDLLGAINADNPGIRITRRDLGSGPVPHLTSVSVAGVRGDAATAQELETAALSDRLIEELKSADLVVIAAPMYNFSIPSSLHAWIDHIVRAGATFSYTPDGPRGLLRDRPTLVICTKGGVYAGGPMQALDTGPTHMVSVLGFLGISSVSLVHAEGLALNATTRTSAIKQASQEARRLVQAFGT